MTSERISICLLSLAGVNFFAAVDTDCFNKSLKVLWLFISGFHSIVPTANIGRPAQLLHLPQAQRAFLERAESHQWSVDEWQQFSPHAVLPGACGRCIGVVGI